MTLRIVAALGSVGTGLALLGFACTNPFPRDQVPYDTSPYDTGDTADTADTGDTDPDTDADTDDTDPFSND